MKRIWGYAAAAAASVAVVAAGSAVLLGTVNGYITPKPPEQTVQSRFDGYLLTVRDGFVVIKSADTDEILYSCDTPQDALSPYDRELLVAGVFFESLDDARAAAADFCG